MVLPSNCPPVHSQNAHVQSRVIPSGVLAEHFAADARVVSILFMLAVSAKHASLGNTLSPRYPESSRSTGRKNRLSFWRHLSPTLRAGAWFFGGDHSPRRSFSAQRSRGCDHISLFAVTTCERSAETFNPNEPLILRQNAGGSGFRPQQYRHSYSCRYHGEGRPTPAGHMAGSRYGSNLPLARGPPSADSGDSVPSMRRPDFRPIGSAIAGDRLQ